MSVIMKQANIIFILMLFIATSVSSFAAPEPTNPKQQTPWKLYVKGYKQVYVVTDGFEGDKIKDGKKKSWRLVNGWKNSDLPWSYKLNQDKMYKSHAF